MNRWKIEIPKKKISSIDFDNHLDDIEESGEKVSGIIKYGIKDNKLIMDRHIVYPLFRFQPDVTQSSFQMDINEPIFKFEEQFNKVELDGILHIYTKTLSFDIVHHFYPSTTLPIFYEQIEIKNTSNIKQEIEYETYKKITTYVKNLSNDLKNAYIYSDDRTNISINVSKSIGDISIPNEIFLHSYNSLYDYYQLELKEGLFYLDNNYVIEIEYSDDYRYADGLYYKPSTASLIEDWIRLYDTDLNLTAIRIESPLSFNSELDYKVVTFFSNTINYDCDLYIENTSILGVAKNRRSEIGYIKYGYNAGKYGHYEYTLYYLDDIVDQILCISFSISLLVSLAVGIILWKKEKYIIDFKNIDFKAE